MNNLESKIRNVIRVWKSIRSGSGLNWSTIDWGEGISEMDDVLLDLEGVFKVPLNIEPPEDDRWVLVATKDEPWWDVDCWFGHYWDANEAEDVLGWMELPERRNRQYKSNSKRQ